MRILSRILVAGALAAFASAPASAQERGAAFLEHALRGITTTARVLIIGAHPDDDATSLVAFLTRGRHIETAYLSLTRGEGAQNYIGLEGGESLGALRTEELLAARRVDGARQFFTRAFDFGSSKTAEETWKHWPHDELLDDVVTVIRAFRPHVIVSVHSGTPADGNGHHEVAGILAREAFDLAADTARFPALRIGGPWQSQILYTRGTTLLVPVDEYDVATGRTSLEVAALSRGQHRSQGFAGMQLDTTTIKAYGLERVVSRAGADSGEMEGTTSLFDGVDTTFARLGRLGPAVAAPLAFLQAQVDSARAAFSLRDMQPIVRHLALAVEAGALARGVTMFCRHPGVDAPGFNPNVARCDTSVMEVEASIDVLRRRLLIATLAAAGLDVRAEAKRELVAYSDSMPVTVTVTNHGREPIQLDAITLAGSRSALLNVALAPDSAVRWTGHVRGLVGTDTWWTGRREKDLFPQQASALDGRARIGAFGAAVPAVSIPEDIRRNSDVAISVHIAGARIVASVGPIVFAANDLPVLGRRDVPIGGVPSVTLALDRNLEFVPTSRPLDRVLRLTMTSFADSTQSFVLGSVAPPGLRVDSLPDSVALRPREQREVLVRLRGALKPGRYEFGIIGRFLTGLEFADGMRTIQYPHVRPMHFMRTPGEYMQALEVAVPPRLSVAYIQGAGDQVIPYLRQLGVPADPLGTDELAGVDLAKYTTIVVGVRAYEAHPELVAYNSRLLDFARKGGTLVVQGGTSITYGLGVFPYPISVPPDAPAQRVTVESAPVQLLDPAARVFTWPNRIGDDDWAGWVQERASFLPSTFDARYAAPLAVNDPGEPPNPGAILVAPLGKGKYVYTTLALARQLPGGVSGAARLFVNLMSAGLSPAPATRTVRH